MLAHALNDSRRIGSNMPNRPIRFERGRVGLEFRALAASLPDVTPGKLDEPHQFVGEINLMGRLKAHINAAVIAGRVRRGLPAGDYFDLEADLPELRETT